MIGTVIVGAFLAWCALMLARIIVAIIVGLVRAIIGR